MKPSKYIFSLSIIAVFFICMDNIYAQNTTGTSQTAGDEVGGYVIPDTGQDSCYNNRSSIRFPEYGGPFFGQDSQYQGNTPSYGDNGDGTVYDYNTGLTWSKAVPGRRVTYLCQQNL